MKKPREYNGHVFEDNGHGDLFNAEVDKFLIFRPYPLLVDTVIHKDGSVTMNQEKFKENTDQKNGNYNEGYELNDDGSVFVKEEDVISDIKKESENNRTTATESEVDMNDDNLEDSGLDNYDKEKLEGLLGYGIPQDVSDDFTDITGEESQAIEDAIAEIDDSLTGYEELNDFENEYGAIRDYDRLDNLEYDLSEYLGNKVDEGEIDESFKNEVENIIGSAEDTANETLDFDIENYLNSHKFGVEEAQEEFAKKFHETTESLKREMDGNYSGLKSKEDYEHDLKWFEDMEREHPTELGLAGNEDYQSLKEQYESEFNTTWNSPESKLPNEQEYRFDFGFKDGSSLRSDAFEDAKAYLEEEDMAQYLDEPLKSKIDSMKWVLDDESHVHVEVKSNQPLYKEDMDALKSEIEGQNSDGLGEGFEQQKFAEGYYDPDTGEGPYSYQEMMDIVTENYDNMDVDDYRDYIDHADIEAAVDNYIQTEAPSYQEYMEQNWDSDIETAILEHADEDQYIAAVSALSDEDFDDYESAQRWVENNSDESEVAREIFDNMDTSDYESIYYDSGMDEAQRELAEEEVLDDIETYLDEDAIERAKQEAAKDDPRFNETLWGDGMISMEWDIPDGVNVTKPIEDLPNNLPSKGYSDYQGLMLADQDNYGEYEFSDNNDLDNFAKSIVNDLNKNKFDDYSDFDYRIDDGHIEIFDKNEAVGSEASDYHKLEEELKKQLGDSVYLEPYDSVTTTIAGIYGQRDGETSISPGIAQQMINNGARKLSPDNEDRIGEESWQEAANMKADTDDEKIDRALRMAASDKIGYETSLSSIINTARHHYSGDKTDEEIAPIARRIANEYGLHYEDDMNNETVKQSLNRAMENNPTGRVVYTDKGKKYYEVGNGQWRSFEDGYDYYLDFNAANQDLPKYYDMVTGELINDNPNYSPMKMSESRRVSVLNGFEEDAYPRRNYRTKQDAYNAYQNGDISFEEYEEIVRKLARR